MSRIIAASVALGALLAPLAAVSASATPTTLYVGPSRPYQTINAAVTAAQNGDTVRVDNGTYVENIYINNKYITLVGNLAGGVTVQSATTSLATLFIQNVPASGSQSLDISGFTLTGGNSQAGQGGGVTFNAATAVLHHNTITGNHAQGYGGGIAVTAGSSPFIYSNTITNNTASQGGGGIFVVTNSVPIIVNNTITGNSTSGAVINNGGSSGGGVYLEATPGNNSVHLAPVLLGNTISNNHAQFAGGGVMMRTGIEAVLEDNDIDSNTAAYGAGVHIETGGAGPNLWGNTITNNVATVNGSFPGSGVGGGVSIYDHSTPTLTGNTISNNFASKYGGGIGAAEFSNSVITGNTISTNSTDTAVSNADGGGILVANATVQVTNNLIHNNTADIGGGVAVLDNGVATIVNNTVVKNNEQESAGGAIFISPSGTTVKVVNNVLAENQGFQIFENISASNQTKARIDNNLFGSPDSASNGINGHQFGFYFNYMARGGNGDITTASGLNSDNTVNAQGNLDGPIDFTNLAGGNFAINPTSAAVDAATTSGVPSVTVDIRNVARATLDIGAYEATNAPVSVLAPTLSGDAEVSKSVSTSNGSWGPLAGTYSYEWLVDGNLVAGEGRSSYAPRLADVDKTVSARVTVTKYGVYTRSQTTGASAGVLRGVHFADVPASSSFVTYIEWMASENISIGTTNLPYAPLYKPVDSVSRQAMAQFLYRLSGETFTAPDEPSFADVDSSSQFYTAIEWMADKGISTGTPDEPNKPQFKPGAAVSRSAMALFLARYAVIDISTPPTEQSFADVPVDASSAAAIAWMKDAGISTGTPQAEGLPLYKPADPVSRQAMAAFLYRLAHLAP